MSGSNCLSLWQIQKFLWGEFDRSECRDLEIYIESEDSNSWISPNAALPHRKPPPKKAEKTNSKYTNLSRCLTKCVWDTSVNSSDGVQMDDDCFLGPWQSILALRGENTPSINEGSKVVFQKEFRDSLEEGINRFWIWNLFWSVTFSWDRIRSMYLIFICSIAS